jgi:hypothetical protein
MTLIFREYLNFISVHEDVEESMDAKVKSFLVAGKLLSTGFPENWQKNGLQQLGLLDYAYKKPVLLTEANGTDRGYILLNITGFVFDNNCSLVALNSSVRVYENEVELPFNLYNQTFCEGSYLKNATIILNVSFSANQSRMFFIYFSNDSSVLPSNYSLPFSTASNFSLEVYPTERMIWLSVEKMKALRQLNYSDAVAALLTGNDLYLEVTE